MAQQDETPVSITSARTSRSDDISRRQFKYLIGMGIRTLCFVLAIVVSGPARWVLITAAFVPAVLRRGHGERLRQPRVSRPGAVRERGPAPDRAPQRTVRHVGRHPARCLSRLDLRSVTCLD